MIKSKRMNAVLSLVLTAAMILALPLSVLAETEKADRQETLPEVSTENRIAGFTDVDPQEWYHDGVYWALEKGVMNGTGENTFEPLAATTRAMIVTMLWRMEGSPKVDDAVTFKDVPEGKWYTDAIHWASANDIINGYDERSFGTNDSVTREQLATVVYRSIKIKGRECLRIWGMMRIFLNASFRIRRHG